ncbi:hypothetical protein [Planococcus dechangensis]|uniref:Tetratricopeptide repeat protein n=1 Tax=Planococcus dechangensis TaxID=1176255 RepID=A0ABV9MDB3_9BACL
MDILTVLGFVWISFFVYKWYFKPVETFGDVISRGFYLSLIGMKKKERDLYLRSLNEMELTPGEKTDLRFILGISFVKNGECVKAISFFDLAFRNYEEVFYYKKEFNLVLDSYLTCKKTDEARELFYFFLERKKFDQKFAKLEKKYSFLL